MDRALRMLYRRLLRRAAVVDSHPAMQLIFRKECHGVKSIQGKSDALYQLWLERLFGPGRCFMPPDPLLDPNFHRVAGIGALLQRSDSRRGAGVRHVDNQVTQSLRETFREGFSFHAAVGVTISAANKPFFTRDAAVEAGLRIQKLLVRVLIVADEMGLLKHQLKAWQAVLCKESSRRTKETHLDQARRATRPATPATGSRRKARQGAKESEGRPSSSFPVVVPDPTPLMPTLRPKSPRFTRCKWWIEALREMLPKEELLTPSEQYLLKGLKPAMALCPGVFLIEHPLAESPVFNRNVMIITQHTTGFSHGLAVNAPPPPFPTHSQGKWLLRAAGGDANYEYLQNQGGFSYGGPSLTLVNVLHAKADLEEPGAQLPQSLPHTRVFCGNSLKTAIDAMRQGGLQRDAVRPFWGAKTWQKHKLDEELAQGMWIMVQAPANLAIEGGGNKHLWEKLLLAMGPPYAELSLIPDDVRDRVIAADGVV